MTFYESENFYKQDAEKYMIKNNKDILNFMQRKKNEGINFILNIEQMQQIIDQIALYFEFKYPDSFLSDLKYENNKTKKDQQICQQLAKQLDIEQLKYRLYHDYVHFLECPYGNYIYIFKEKENLWDMTCVSIRIDKTGEIEPYGLIELKEQNFLHNIEGVEKVSDLLGRFIESPIDVNYSELTKAVITHKANIQLRNMILNLIPLKMIYSKSTLPEYGYIRAKSFVRMFNKEYELNIDMKEVENILRTGYSNEKTKCKTPE